MPINCSVVLASCEGQAFISEQLRSIVSQIGPEDEVIVSDDASTDETVEVVRRSNDPRVKVVVNDKRLGYVNNFSRAVEMARGEYVFLSDQDDIWLPNKVQIISEILKRKACVASDAIVVDERLNKLHGSYFRLRETRGFSPMSLLLRPSIIGATLACRRNYLASLLPFPSGVPHDFWLSINASLDHELEVVGIPLILYRRHVNALSPTATPRRRSLMRIASERSDIVRTLLWRRWLKGAISHRRNRRS